MANPTIADRFSAQRPTTPALYADFFVNFNAHPDSNQLMLIKNEAAVIRSIKNLIFTNKYERLFQPSVGSNIRNFLFENDSPQALMSLKNDIKLTIENYEPRAKVIDINVLDYPDNNAYVVTIILMVTNIAEPIKIQFPLVKVR